MRIIMDDEVEGPMAAVEDIVGVGDKWLSVVEAKLPAAAFINGFDFPTAADLAVLNMAKGFIPFGAAYMLSDYDALGSFPKFADLADRVAAYPPVKAYLDQSETMDADPMDLRGILESSPSWTMTLTKSMGFKSFMSTRDSTPGTDVTVRSF